MNIVDSWDKLTIGKYQEVLALQGVDSKIIVDANIELALCLSDYSREDILKMKLTDLKGLVAKFDFLLKIPEGEPKKFFDLKDKKFVVWYEYDKINAGQFAEICHFTKDEKLINQNLHLILASLIIDSDKKMTHAQRADLFLDNMPMSIAYGWSVFFWKVMQLSSGDIADYFLLKAEKMLIEAEANLNILNNGGGI